MRKNPILIYLQIPNPKNYLFIFFLLNFHTFDSNIVRITQSLKESGSI